MGSRMVPRNPARNHLRSTYHTGQRSPSYKQSESLHHYFRASFTILGRVLRAVQIQRIAPEHDIGHRMICCHTIGRETSRSRTTPRWQRTYKTEGLVDEKLDKRLTARHEAIYDMSGKRSKAQTERVTLRTRTTEMRVAGGARMTFMIKLNCKAAMTAAGRLTRKLERQGA